MKNIVGLLTDNEMIGKTIGFLWAAGGANSYMSVMSFVNSLMLDFRCWICHRFVNAIGSDFSNDAIASDKLRD